MRIQHECGRLTNMSVAAFRQGKALTGSRQPYRNMVRFLYRRQREMMKS